ncbi:MAG: tetratricopeptide repeat protein [Pseudomonadota bacterium]
MPNRYIDMLNYHAIRIFTVISFLLIFSGCSSLRTMIPSSSPEELLEPIQPQEESSLLSRPVAPELQAVFSEALIYMQQKQYQQAINAFTTILQNYPDASGASLNIAIAYQHLQDLEKALEYVIQATQNNPKNYIAFDVKGQVLRERGEFKAAKQAYATAITINKSYANAYLNAGILADLYLHDFVAAKNFYQEYLNLTGQPNKKVEGWIIDLNRRIK